MRKLIFLFTICLFLFNSATVRAQDSYKVFLPIVQNTTPAFTPVLRTTNIIHWQYTYNNVTYYSNYIYGHIYNADKIKHCGFTIDVELFDKSGKVMDNREYGVSVERMMYMIPAGRFAYFSIYIKDTPEPLEFTYNLTLHWSDVCDDSIERLTVLYTETREWEQTPGEIWYGLVIWVQNTTPYIMKDTTLQIGLQKGATTYFVATSNNGEWLYPGEKRGVEFSAVSQAMLDKWGVGIGDVVRVARVEGYR